MGEFNKGYGERLRESLSRLYRREGILPGICRKRVSGGSVRYPVMFIGGPVDGHFGLVSQKEVVPKLWVPTIFKESYRYESHGQRFYITPDGSQAILHEYHCTGYDAEHTEKTRKKNELSKRDQ